MINETLVVKYMDKTRERLDMLVKDFIKQTGISLLQEELC